MVLNVSTFESGGAVLPDGEDEVPTQLGLPLLPSVSPPSQPDQGVVAVARGALSPLMLSAEDVAFVVAAAADMRHAAARSVLLRASACPGCGARQDRRRGRG